MARGGYKVEAHACKENRQEKQSMPILQCRGFPIRNGDQVYDLKPWKFQLK